MRPLRLPPSPESRRLHSVLFGTACAAPLPPALTRTLPPPRGAMGPAVRETGPRPWRLGGIQVGGLRPAAWAYWSAIVAPAAIGIVLAACYVGEVDWSSFAVLAALASISQLLSFHLNR